MSRDDPSVNRFHIHSKPESGIDLSSSRTLAYRLADAARWAAPAVLALDLVAGTAQARDLSPALELPGYELPTLGPIAVTPFVLQADDETRARAIHCLTEAVYYEAESEPREGQEAVAQVVLNRLKHPGFPKSVCGVVFEGSERATGCQFTFTCDGSLTRRPVSWRWDAAEQVAAAALNGHVAADVGPATHYHAVWMTPYWSKTLIPINRIGGHVFYRMPGRQGSAELLIAQYDGAEPSPGASATAAYQRESIRARRSSNAPRTHARAVTQFSVWGLKIATLSTAHGELVVRGDPDRTEQAAPPNP